ncbi:unnamed protein product [Polarella glacialis]|uniref:Plant heme peroxidase family profile domain-containing protein n=1 Tax=Polarella glacialis TaxID=89957 RepID=A0A813IU14_POLGL|nr:unnamed protein product [Polarella glacialis]
MLRKVLLLASPLLSLGACPFGGEQGVLPDGHPAVAQETYAAALGDLDLDLVRSDLKALFLKSQDHWPADLGNYAPFFVRLTWHCTGTYRSSDGRGGCEGGRQRFEPERSWADNTNLDKARALLWPVKAKYGDAISWGDLMVLAGTTAIESMGGPVLGFCAGRLDDKDGFESIELGPSEEQEAVAPCVLNGTCVSPLGSTTVGLIYVNPEGPLGNPIPAESALQVRDSFARMGMNDSETVALIGGGHAFGKVHGACPAGAGPSPKEDPLNPYPGLCGTGKGKDTFTSGFEGPWTTTPNQWSNLYFNDLLNNDWEVHVGPGGHHQWRIPNATGPMAGIMRLTTDISLLHDPAGIYQKIVKEFAADQAKFDNAFAHAWYKLASRDMGPALRCLGQVAAPPFPWYPSLPARSSEFPPAWPQVKASLKEMARGYSKPIFPADVFSGQSYYGGLFLQLAWRCASTFRQTDYRGGCNGARIRFSPEKDWPANAELDGVLKVLDDVKARFGDALSWSDLIILAGTVAVEEAGGLPMSFCGGRTDATDGSGSENLAPRLSPGPGTDLAFLVDGMKVMGLTRREFVALVGGGHTLGQMHASRSSFISGPWTSSPSRFNNEYFTNLLTEVYQEVSVQSGEKKYKAVGKELFMLKTDLFLKADPEFRIHVEEFALDNQAFLESYRAAWTKLVRSDRFDDPTGKLCEKDTVEEVAAASEVQAFV